MKDRAEGKMVLSCHMHRTVKSPNGETYTVSIDRRGIWLGNGKLAWLTLPVGWPLHKWRWPDQWWLRAARRSQGREYRQWRHTGEANARDELERLVSNIESGLWHDGRQQPKAPGGGAAQDSFSGRVLV